MKAPANKFICLLFFIFIIFQSIYATDGLDNLTNDQTITSLINDLDIEDGEVITNAMDKLVEIGGLEVVDALILETFCFLDQRRTLYASLIIRELDNDLVVDRLLKFIDNEDPSIRLNCLIMLKELGGNKLNGGMFESTIIDEEPLIRTESIKILKKIGDKKSIDLLIEATRDNDPDVKSDALLAYTHLVGEEALAILEKTILDEDYGVRINTVIALNSLKSIKTINLLKYALTDENKRVRSWALFSLENLNDPKILIILTEALNSEYEDVRNEARKILNSMQ